VFFVFFALCGLRCCCHMDKIKFSKFSVKSDNREVCVSDHR